LNRWYRFPYDKIMTPVCGKSRVYPMIYSEPPPSCSLLSPLHFACASQERALATIYPTPLQQTISLMAFNYLSEKVTYRKHCLKSTLTLTPLHEKENTLNGNLSLLKNTSRGVGRA